MNCLKISLVLALGGSLLTACGDDDGDKPTQSNDAAIVDSAVSKPDSSSAADAGSPDASLSPPKDSGANTMDSGPRDSGMKVTDSGSTDSGTTDSGSSLLTSAACTSCVTSSCTLAKLPNASGADDFKFCDTFTPSELAQDGRKVGTARKTLCEAVGACMAKSGCGNPVRKPQADGGAGPSSYFPCLCGTQDSDSCFLNQKAADFKGPCVGDLFDAAETTDVQTLLERLADPTYALGRAANLFNCATRICGDECFAACQGQPDGVSCNATDGTGNMTTEGKCSANKCSDNPSAYGL